MPPYIMAAGWLGDSGTLVLHADVSGPPFTFEVSFSSKGSVIPKTGVATISGTVVCSEPGEVFIDGELRQRNGRTNIRGFFFVSVECSQEPTSFTATVSGSNGLFVAGKAAIFDVFIDGCGATDCDFEFLEGEVTMVKLGR